MTARPRPLLCLVTDRRRLAPEARSDGQALQVLDAAIDEAVVAGIDVVQLRERDLEAAPLAAWVTGVVARTRATATRVYVNDRADIALVAGADGVHLRADGPASDRVRTLGPATWSVGRSVHTLREIETQQAADYLLFGTVLPSASKADGAPTQGLAALAAAVGRSGTPVWAIGGITVVTARAVALTGVAGIAAIGAFIEGAGSAGRVRENVAALRRAVAGDFGKLVE